MVRQYSLCGDAADTASPPEEVVQPGAGRVTVVAEDEDGRPGLDALFAELSGRAAVCCCGPERFLAAVAQRVPDVRSERFAAGVVNGGAFEWNCGAAARCRRSG
ncbi:hypothetical protein [Streptomyces sp. ID05-39B]|uniref:hypothetical protein n=1 Tax=Streptomyces sp. ID05-39B TaxID=3028664 RepID=UPI0029BFD166|nr:hypothetical protein [Streptomyces sp. ID05-39B]